MLIFDEAHNIEDIARDSASCDITLRDLKDARDDMKGVYAAVNVHFLNRE